MVLGSNRFGVTLFTVESRWNSRLYWIDVIKDFVLFGFRYADDKTNLTRNLRIVIINFDFWFHWHYGIREGIRL